MGNNLNTYSILYCNTILRHSFLLSNVSHRNLVIPITLRFQRIHQLAHLPLLVLSNLNLSGREVLH